MATEPDTITLLADVTFPECPRWRGGRLWFSDFMARRVRTVTEDGTSEQVARVAEQPAGLGWLDDGRLLVVSMVDRRVLRLDPDGLALHADLAGVATFHANDLLTDPAGNAYVGNYGYDLGGGAPARDAALALVRPEGRVEVVAEGLRFPNGMALSPDGGTLLVAETLGERISAFDVGADSTLGPQRTWAALPGRYPDGCCLDADGALWVAVPPEPRCVRLDHRGRVTDEVVTSRPCIACALGGTDGRTLFLTTSSFGAGHNDGDGRLGRIETASVTVAAA